MIVLAIDSSHPVGSVALAVDGATAGGAQFGQGASHLADIGRAVAAVLAGAGVPVTEVDRVALVRGPGSFTGLRIGMAYAKGLCAGLRADLVVVSTLELLATPVLRTGAVACAMIDARRGEVYGAVYRPAPGQGGDRWSAPVEPRARGPEEMVAVARSYHPVYVGTGALTYRSLVSSADPGCRIGDERQATPSTAVLAGMAPALEPLPTGELADLEPIYLRPSDAVFRRLKPVDPHG